MAGTVPAKSDGVCVIHAVQEIGGNPATSQFENRLGVSVLVRGNPRQIRLHATIIATTTCPGQTHPEGIAVARSADADGDR
jgi:hypothetical protein